MTNLVSVITAVHAPSIPYLRDAYASLAGQELPSGWGWEWVIQEDGLSGAVADVVPSDPRIKVGANRKGGAAITRNMALARAGGTLIKILDADDQLTPGAIARDIAVLTGYTSIGWTTARVLDLMPDGSTRSWEHSDPPNGPISRGDVLRYFQHHNYRLPVHPACLCIRRDLILALGGWMALPGGEDTGLLLAASMVSDGYFIGKPGLLYRKWEGQLTNRPDWAGTSEWNHRMRLIEARAQALQRLPVTLGTNGGPHAMHDTEQREHNHT